MSRVIVVGSGGREHAIAWKLAQSNYVKEVLLVPGNAGTALHGGKLKNCTEINLENLEGFIAYCHKEPRINLVIVGPEAPLASGLSDTLNSAGIYCFGPSAAAAKIEADKAYAHNFMNRYGILSARTRDFINFSEAENHIRNAPYRALVIKAAGLAAGKGVVVAKDVEEAIYTAKSMLVDDILGHAGHHIVIEEVLEGPEVSCLAFTDGKTIVPLPPAQDHKRLLDGDNGPNTGGMGAYCPCPLVSQSVLDWIYKEVLQRAVDGMRAEGQPFVGVLYAGLMLTSLGPRVLEFNCRFGDPEAQVLLPLLKGDLYKIAVSCVEGKLHDIAPDILFETSYVAVAVVAASKGYPNAYEKKKTIHGLDLIKNPSEIKINDEACILLFHSGTELSIDGLSVQTCGGRVLVSVAIHRSLLLASYAANSVFDRISFDGIQFRSDIGHNGLVLRCGLTYRNAGVDVAVGNKLVRSILPILDDTRVKGCIDITSGLFGAGFSLKDAMHGDISIEGPDPVLVSGMDGVGTKIAVAISVGKHFTIGQDLVAMCVNDILCHGAKPLFFLDYFGSCKLDVEKASQIVEGIGKACIACGCALVGGETAELPGVYKPLDYELVGCAVGVVQRSSFLPRLQNQIPGDVMIALPSSGLHSNGFSLARRCADNIPGGLAAPCPWSPHVTLGEMLLTPTRLYVSSLLPVLQSGFIKAAAHITGGGLLENIPRVLRRGLHAKFFEDEWLPLPPVFSWLAETGALDDDELARTFNCGLGMVLIVAAENAEYVRQELIARNEHPLTVGHLIAGETSCTAPRVFLPRLRPLVPLPVVQPPSSLRRVAVLISGSGTNLQSILNHCMSSDSVCRVVLVISNVPNVGGLKRALAAGVPSETIPHTKFKTRIDFEAEIHRRLEKSRVDIVCLAGFMRILTENFVKHWSGRMLNIHPSLLPSFPGAHAHRDVLNAGVRVSGATVHFVVPEVDAGAILEQEAVPVHHEDTEDSLAERVKLVEHLIYPRALEALARNYVRLLNGKAVWNN